MPRPTKTSINIKPSVTPSKCGVVLLKPKLAPELINIKLFGPGVIDDTKANNAKAVKISKLIAISPFEFRCNYKL